MQTNSEAPLPAPAKRQSSSPASSSGGPEGNERLTAMTGLVLLILLLVECYTIFNVGHLITVHVFLGMLLLRVIGPLIMLSTACIFGSGIMLAVTGASNGGPSGWLEIHRISFIAWCFFIVVHVLAYVPRVPRLLAAEARGISLGPDGTDGHADAGRHARRAMEVLGGRRARLALLTASLLAGLVIALFTVHLAGNWEQFG
jgi:hypothetical protein